MRIGFFYPIAVLLVLGGTFATLHIDSNFVFYAGYVVLQFVVLATAWNILGGFTGYVNFGSAAFFAVGAYTTIALNKAFGLPLYAILPIAGLVAGLIGFSALLMGGFSRFGLWRQIATASVLLIVVQLLVNAVASAVKQSPGLWPAVYLPEAAGFLLSVIMLALAGRRRRVRPATGLAVPS